MSEVPGCDYEYIVRYTLNGLAWYDQFYGWTELSVAEEFYDKMKDDPAFLSVKMIGRRKVGPEEVIYKA